MSQRAIDYVNSLAIAHFDVETVFLLLAVETADSALGSDGPMGVRLEPADIPRLASRCGMGEEQFRDVLRRMKSQVRMDVLEHKDGVWEIVYGPYYTEPRPRPARDGDPIEGVNSFTMPGWERYSTWGLDTPLGREQDAYLYAQLYFNTDNCDAAPRIWITPPRHVATTLDELAEAIATAIGPLYRPVDIPAQSVRRYLTVYRLP